jgi:hypothetical protein
MVESHRQGKISYSSNKALWQSYQQSHPAINQKELNEGNEFVLRNIFVHTVSDFFTWRKI